MRRHPCVPNEYRPVHYMIQEHFALHDEPLMKKRHVDDDIANWIYLASSLKYKHSRHYE